MEQQNRDKLDIPSERLITLYSPNNCTLTFLVFSILKDGLDEGEVLGLEVGEIEGNCNANEVKFYMIRRF